MFCDLASQFVPSCFFPLRFAVPAGIAQKTLGENPLRAPFRGRIASAVKSPAAAYREAGRFWKKGSSFLASSHSSLRMPIRI
ncbi:hypothetical protein, partial [Caldifermentibacillus hisashii]|uniref:hypothetical protein n=1 Tax=Caldifermentibacillus hisashii TaxID=996558 RepID=UPI001B356817